MEKQAKLRENMEKSLDFIVYKSSSESKWKSRNPRITVWFRYSFPNKTVVRSQIIGY